MTIIFRHEGYPREDDGASEWRKLLSMFYREDPELKWTEQAWLNSWRMEAKIKESGVAWTPMETFCTCVPPKATLRKQS